jgi:predicted secreted acid phosphatase
LKSVAVAIGIAHAGSLPELPGAVNGAKKFCDWAKQQGYEVHLVSDETAEVTVEKLKTLIKDIIDEGETERLVIYFAGHGIQPSYNTAYWLLSRWDNDSDEAINFNLSFANAKRSVSRPTSRRQSSRFHSMSLYYRPRRSLEASKA